MSCVYIIPKNSSCFAYTQTINCRGEAVQRKVSEMCTNGPTQSMDVCGLVEI